MRNEKMQHAMSHAVFLGIYMIIVFYITVYFFSNLPAYSIGQLMIFCLVILLMMLVGPVAVYYFQKKFRDDKSGGFITYSSAFTYGIYLFFYASLILGIGQYILFQFFVDLNQFLGELPTALENMIKQNGEIINSQTKELIDKSFSTEIPSPIHYALSYIANNCFMGIIISAITSAIVKRTDRYNSFNG